MTMPEDGENIAITILTKELQIAENEVKTRREWLAESEMNLFRLKQALEWVEKVRTERQASKEGA